VQVDESTAGLDLFIGEIDYYHRGFGTAILNKFLLEVVFSDDRFVSCVIGPDPKNRAAIKCYKKVGF
jgi:RimJ/RimL family protein N-acetyltransferase